LLPDAGMPDDDPIIDEIALLTRQLRARRLELRHTLNALRRRTRTAAEIREALEKARRTVYLCWLTRHRVAPFVRVH